MSYQANIWKMYAFKFFRSLHFFAGVLVPFFIDWGGITFFQIMILQSIYVFASFLMEIPTGAVADYFGRKTSVVFGAFLTLIAVIIYSLYPAFWIFVIGEICWATANALLSGADNALVYDSLKRFKSEKSSKKIFSKIASFEISALMISAPIGSMIAYQFGVRYTMVAMAFPMFIACLIAFSLKEPKTKKKVESKRYLNVMFEGIKYFKDHKELKILAFDMVSVSSLLFFVIWFYQPLLTEMNIPIIYFGFVFAGMSAAQLLFLNNFERLEKLFGSRKRYLLLSAVIPGIAFAALGFTKSVLVVVLLLLLIEGFGLSRKALFDSYFNKHIDSHNRATVLSTISMVDRFTRGIMYPLAGLMVVYSLNYAFVIIGILVVICAFVSRVEEGHLLD